MVSFGQRQWGDVEGVAQAILDDVVEGIDLSSL